MINHPGGLMPSQACRLDANSHVSEHEGDGLVMSDGYSECFTLQRVVSSLDESALRETCCAGCHLHKE